MRACLHSPDLSVGQVLPSGEMKVLCDNFFFPYLYEVSLCWALSKYFFTWNQSCISNFLRIIDITGLTTVELNNLKDLF